MKLPRHIIKDRYPFYDLSIGKDIELDGESVECLMDIHSQQFKDEITQLKQQLEATKPLYVAAQQILHLHLCEQEGILSGQPTREQWIDAVDKLSKALHP